MVNQKSNKRARIAITVYIVAALIGIGVISSPLFKAKASLNSTLPVLNTSKIGNIDGMLKQRKPLPPFTPMDLSTFTFGNPEPFR
jgi:hypothetical protein